MRGASVAPHGAWAPRPWLRAWAWPWWPCPSSARRAFGRSAQHESMQACDAVMAVLHGYAYVSVMQLVRWLTNPRHAIFSSPHLLFGAAATPVSQTPEVAARGRANAACQSREPSSVVFAIKKQASACIVDRESLDLSQQRAATLVFPSPHLCGCIPVFIAGSVCHHLSFAN